MRYPQLASRIFGVPLMIERHKFDVILTAIGPRLEIETDTPEPEAYGPGDRKGRKSYHVSEDGIATISIVGPLVKRNSGAFMSGGPTSYAEVETEFMDAVTDPNVKAVMLMIDSPGGESTGAFELADLIYSQRGSKPIYAAADGDAFSAAYAIASAADRLYVTKSGGVGSVGVWMMHVDQSESNKQKGLKPTFIFAGARKIDGNPHEPLTDDAREVFQSEVDRIYSMFLDTVARNRDISATAVKKTEAGLFFGDAAVKVGFADAVGTFADAMKDLRAAMQSRKSVSAAASVASPIPQKKGASMIDEPKADAETPVAAEGAPVAPEPVAEPPAPEPEAAVESATVYADTEEVLALCAVAGKSAKVAQEFIAQKKSAKEVAHALLAEKVAASGDEIISQIQPGSGASAKTETKDSPIVKAAERLAQAGKEGK